MTDDPQAVAIAAIAEETMRWPFRMWSFGEAVALDGLLAASRRLGSDGCRRYVAALCLAAIARGVGASPDDHAAPGRAFLGLHAATGDARFLDAARRLVALHEGLPRNAAGALLVRAHQPGWRHQVWVDSMDLVGPLFARFAEASGEDGHYRRAVDLTLAHARLLQDESGLFFHGFDSFAGRNGHLWARGNGWALCGMTDTLIAVPPETPGRAELRERLAALAGALVRTQRPSGLWTTVVDRPETAEETTLAAMAAHALGRAAARGLVEGAAVAEAAGRARAAVRRHVDAEGRLALVSEATPVGQLSIYATRPFGVFPWGQGPLLLMECDE